MSHLVRGSEHPHAPPAPWIPRPLPTTKCLVYVGDPLIHSDSWETSHSHPKSSLPQPKCWQQRGGQSWDKDPPPFKKTQIPLVEWLPVLRPSVIITTTHFFTSLTSCLVIPFFCVNKLFSSFNKLLTLIHFSFHLIVIISLPIVLPRCHKAAEYFLIKRLLSGTLKAWACSLLAYSNLASHNTTWPVDLIP